MAQEQDKERAGYEHQHAVMEANRNAKAEEYFKARHEMLDTIAHRRIFEAGFERGWAERATAALRARGAVPSGWKLVPVERSYDQRAKALIAFNTTEAKKGCDRDDALQAAWEAMLAAAPAAPMSAQGVPFQQRVQPWMMECFGPMISGDREERNHRFIEEALELVQSTGCSASEAHQLVDYVYGRPVGEPAQEVGGVMVTLAALCLANKLDMHSAAEVELARIWTKVDEIRAKQAAKPKHSPLPMTATPGSGEQDVGRIGLSVHDPKRLD